MSVVLVTFPAAPKVSEKAIMKVHKHQVDQPLVNFYYYIDTYYLGERTADRSNTENITKAYRLMCGKDEQDRIYCVLLI